MICIRVCSCPRMCIQNTVPVPCLYEYIVQLISSLISRALPCIPLPFLVFEPRVCYHHSVFFLQNSTNFCPLSFLDPRPNLPTHSSSGLSPTTAFQSPSTITSPFISCKIASICSYRTSTSSSVVSSSRHVDPYENNIPWTETPSWTGMQIHH